jgi:hypothetical protein
MRDRVTNITFFYQGFDLKGKMFFNITMVKRFQNAILKGGFVFTLLNLALFSAGSFLLWRQSLYLRDFYIQETLPWWLRPKILPTSSQLVLYCLISVLALLVFALLIRISLGGLYRKTKAPEIFFLMLFAVSLCLENLRVGVILCQAWSLPADLSLLLSRGVYLGRTLAMLSLLAASVYAAGLRYSNLAVLTGLLFLISLTLAAIVPLNTVMLQVNFIHTLGDRQGYLFLNSGLGIIIILNFLIARLTGKDARFLYMAAAALFLLLGKELLSFAIAPLVLAAGLLFLVLGSVLFVRNVGIYYLGL